VVGRRATATWLIEAADVEYRWMPNVVQSWVVEADA
jgi:hypothetical protein